MTVKIHHGKNNHNPTYIRKGRDEEQPTTTHKKMCRTGFITYLGACNDLKLLTLKSLKRGYETSSMQGEHKMRST
jgi:hypothetical protein